jgi:hypothetical protein
VRRIRNILADVIVGIVVVVVALWLVRGVFRLVYWGGEFGGHTHRGRVGVVDRREASPMNEGPPRLWGGPSRQLS